MGRKGYTEAEIADTLVKLAVNKGNLKKTSAETGVSTMTIYRWQKNQVPAAGSESVAVMVESVVKHLLSNIPDKMSGHDWAITLGILLDKYMIMQGGVNSRTENININENTDTKDLHDEEFFDQINQANAAISRLSDGAGEKKKAAKRSI